MLGVDEGDGEARAQKREGVLRRLLSRFDLLRFSSSADFYSGVHIYRQCRHIGVTRSGLTDCMIASVAQRFGTTLLAHDADLTRVIGIEMDAASFSLRNPSVSGVQLVTARSLPQPDELRLFCERCSTSFPGSPEIASGGKAVVELEDHHSVGEREQRLCSPGVSSDQKEGFTNPGFEPGGRSSRGRGPAVAKR
jgi:hypothetical protein